MTKFELPPGTLVELDGRIYIKTGEYIEETIPAIGGYPPTEVGDLFKERYVTLTIPVNKITWTEEQEDEYFTCLRIRISQRADSARREE